MKKILFLFCGLLLMAGCDKDTVTEDQQNRSPSPFALVSPDEEIGLDVYDITFTWEATTDPDGDPVTYSLYLYKFGELPIQLARNLTTTSYTLEGRSSFDTSYTWYVVASDGKEKGETTSVEHHFVTRSLRMGQISNVNPEPAFTQKRFSYSALYFKDRFFVMNGFAKEVLGDVWSSANYGKNWLLRSDMTNTDFRRYGHSSLIFDNKMWIIGGYDDDAPVGNIYSSTDGFDWNRELYAASDFDNPVYRYDHNSVSFDNKIWIIGGHDDTSLREDVISWTGKAEDPWVLQGNIPLGGLRGHTTVVHGGKIWLIGGANAQGDLNRVWQSANGRDWVAGTNLPIRSSGHKSVVFDNKIWFIGNGSKGIYYYDENTSTWTSYETPEAFNGAYNHEVITVDEGTPNDGIYILGSFDSTTYFTHIWKLY